MSPTPARVDELKKRYEENPRRFFAPLANEYRKAGDLDAAIDLCRMHLEEQPGHLSGHIVFGQALFESARTAEAKTIFEAALTLDPENLIALRHLGDIAKNGGDVPAATHWYNRVLEADPRNEEVTALIDSLSKETSASNVVVAEPHAPPPSPDYALQQMPPLAAVVDSSAPTPVIPVAAIPPAAPPAPAARQTLGLMDLDLNLADSTAPTVDFLTDVQSAAPAASETPPPMAAEPAPAIDELRAIDLSTEPQEAAPDVHDTSFDAEPVADEPTFAPVGEESSFGDSLDVTASSELETSAPDRMSLLDSLPIVDDGGLVSIGESITEPKPVRVSAAELAPVAEPVTEPTPVTATPATPGDFDALFGNAPIADVQIGGEAEPAVPDASGFIADSFIGREPGQGMLESAPELAAPPSPFVTETMAELYLQQGFREEALGVYRQLLAQNPADAGLAERVRHLEHGTRSSLALDSVSEQIEAAAAQDAARQSGSTAVEPLAEAVPAFLVEAPVAPVAPEVPAVAAAAPVVVGPTAHEVFARVAARRAVPGGGFSDAGAVEAPAPVADRSATASAAPAALAAELGVAPGGAIDQLFGMGGVAAVDEGAAAAMAAAFSAVALPATTAVPIKGEPTRPGTDELSLASVFRSDEAQHASGVQRQSTRLRFDQFFAGANDASAAPAPSPTPAPGKGEDDVAQFSDWLKGLKGS